MLILILLGWGIAWFLARSALFEPPRALISKAPWVGGFLDGLLHCAACTGFWAGLGLSAAAPVLRPLPGFWGILAGGVVVMGANAILDSFVVLFSVASEFVWALKENHSKRHLNAVPKVD